MADANNENGGGRATRPLNEIRRNDGQERGTPTRDIPADLAKHYHQVDNSYRSPTNHDRIEFVDRGSRMHGYNPVSAFTARAMVQIAESRGWKSLELTGVNDFKSKVFVESAKRGIGVRGYEPTDKDREILQRHADRSAAAANPKVQAFLAAESGDDMVVAAQRYPELVNAFVIRSALRKQSEQLADASPRSRQQWLGARLDRVVLALHRGEPLPDVQLRQTPSAERESQAGDEGR